MTDKIQNKADALPPPPKGGRVGEGGHTKPSPRRWAENSALVNARRLRREMTDAERLLWQELRGKRLIGYRFRRQVPLGRFVADFACMAPRLVVELDGGQLAERSGRDDARTAWLESQGFRVLRLWNKEVSGNIEGVLQVIVETLRELDDG